MDYRSPIEIYTHEPTFKEMEDGIMRATASCGVQIDKDELIRALAYDREQYRAGYEAAERKYKRPEGEWTYNLEQGDPISIECPLCGATIYISGDVPDDENYLIAEDYNFCPNCGAKMGGIGE